MARKFCDVSGDCRSQGARTQLPDRFTHPNSLRGFAPRINHILVIFCHFLPGSRHVSNNFRFLERDRPGYSMLSPTGGRCLKATGAAAGDQPDRNRPGRWHVSRASVRKVRVLPCQASPAATPGSDPPLPPRPGHPAPPPAAARIARLLERNDSDREDECDGSVPGDLCTDKSVSFARPCGRCCRTFNGSPRC